MSEVEGREHLVLVADDDRHIVELVAFYLERAGFRVAAARDGDEALRILRDREPSLAILDIMMPGPDGLQICTQLARREGPPVLLLTARSSDIDKIAGLRLGADDYVTKPFNPDELVARVEAILRRTGRAPKHEAARITLGPLEVDLPSRTAKVAGAALSLTPREFDLLATMSRFPDVVLDRDHLLDLVWGTSYFGGRTVDVHIARLREKLRGTAIRIETSWGAGYRLVVEESP